MPEDTHSDPESEYGDEAELNRDYDSLTDKQQAVVDAFRTLGDQTTYADIQTHVREELDKNVSHAHVGTVYNQFPHLIEQSHICPDCGKSFETGQKLSGHVNSNRTDCTWDATADTDTADDDEIDPTLAAHLDEFGPDAQLSRTFQGLTNKQRRTVHALVNAGRNTHLDESDIADNAGVSDSYVSYVLDNFPHIVDRRLSNQERAQQAAADGGEEVFQVRLTESEVWQAIRDLPDELSTTIFEQVHDRDTQRP